jgi:formylglycine-generating enzyme required for sulfatase activity
MIDRLLIAMQERGLLLSDREIDAFSEAQSFLHDEDIVDALWLASKIGGAYEVAKVVKADEPKDKTDELEDKADEPEDKTDSIAPNTSTRVIDDPNSRLVIPNSVPLIPKSSGDQDSQPREVPEKGLPIQVQSAPALPDTRSIARSLRPLMRKVPSLNRVELDEMATVNRIAERDIWVPILKRSPERWFDLELVVEASEFSFIWQDTINEFQHLLENQGAFRNVRTWNVRASEAGKPRLEVKKQWNVEVESGSSSRSPKELIDASGRCLVLYVSDCRSQIWQQGQIHDWLALWSKHCPTTIVQLLPERLWRQSELDVGFAVQAGSLIPGAVNSQLQVREIGVRTQIAPADALTLPIVTLTANALKQWALVVAAAGRQRVPARLFDLSWVQDPKRDRMASVIRPKSAEARVELFMATASVAAQKLAEMMAAVPVEMSVVRLIQQELLPDLTPVHIAEVYSSDLLEKERQPTADLPIRYSFAKGVRGLLNERTPLDETFSVIEALSKRIARTLGFEIDSFTALLSPKSDWTPEQKNAILPFAQVTTEVLHRLGGDYAELAQLVDRDASRRSDWIKSFTPDDDPKFPKLEALTFTTAQLVEAEAGWPPLQVEEYTVATITFDPPAQSTLAVEPFTFKIATLVRSRNFWDWGVQKSDGRAYRYIEQIDENITLEMVGIKGGKFMMGSPAEEPESNENERPQHLVTVPDFYLGRYPVTQAQWRLVAAMPQEKRELVLDPSNFRGDTRPVEQVSWFDAIEFCARLSKHTKRQYRLPTEAEWEYACRAGTTTPFHFGETISTELANYNGSIYADGPIGNSRKGTTPVEHFDIANAWGICDMHGNVWEWCQDHWHDNYNSAPENGNAWLTDDDTGAYYVYRGGSWLNIPRICRSAYRFNYFPTYRSDTLGFRLVCATS